MSSSIGGLLRQDSPCAVDEMLEGGQMDANDVNEETINGSSGQAASNLLNDLTANDRTVHVDFQKKFGIDLFDDKDLN